MDETVDLEDCFDLEDCYWLDVVRVSLRELRARQLRVVTPARSVVQDHGSDQC